MLLVARPGAPSSVLAPNCPPPNLLLSVDLPHDVSSEPNMGGSFVVGLPSQMASGPALYPDRTCCLHSDLVNRIICTRPGVRREQMCYLVLFISFCTVLRNCVDRTKRSGTHGRSPRCSLYRPGALEKRVAACFASGFGDRNGWWSRKELAVQNHSGCSLLFTPPLIFRGPLSGPTSLRGMPGKSGRKPVEPGCQASPLHNGCGACRMGTAQRPRRLLRVFELAWVRKSVERVQYVLSIVSRVGLGVLLDSSYIHRVQLVACNQRV